MNRILGVVTAVFLLSISITPSAFGEDYTWHLSYSSSDPNVHTQAPVPSPGQFKVYLWLKYTGADGMSAAELGIQYSGYFGHSFTPLNGVLNAGNADNLLLAVGGCPMGPFLAGSFGDYIDLDGGGGMLCIGNTTEFAMRNVTVDCALNPSPHDNGVIGCADDGTTPCSTTAVEAVTWGGGKSLYR